MPGDDVRRLLEADPLGPRRDCRLYDQRIRAHLDALRLEVVLGLNPTVETKLLGQDALANLRGERAARLLHHILDVAINDVNVVFREVLGRQVAPAVMEYSEFDHSVLVPWFDLGRLARLS